jgi:hypothetical protein
MVKEQDKGNDVESGEEKYLLPSCSRDHQVGEPILFYGNRAPPPGGNNSARVHEGATQRIGSEETRKLVGYDKKIPS